MKIKSPLFKSFCIFGLCLSLVILHLGSAAYATSFPDLQNHGIFRYDYGVFLGIDDSKTNRLKNYQTIVIDADSFSKKNIKKLKKQGHTVYTYLNIGSLETFRPDYDEYKKYTLAEYENWSDERWIDVSQVKWQKRIASLAETYHKKGVDGFFIDNCDVYDAMGLSLEGKARQKVSSDKLFQGLTIILENLRQSYQKDVIINGGDTFVKACTKKNMTLTNYLTAVNQENVFSAYDFKNNKMKKSSSSHRKYYLKYFDSLPDSIDIFVLEYTKSSSLKKLIKKECKRYGFRYYIADSIKLN